MTIWKNQAYMPVLSVSADFKTPAVYDEVLELACRVSKLKGASIEIEYEIRGEESGEVHVRGKSSHGFTTPDLKPVRLKKKRRSFTISSKVLWTKNNISISRGKLYGKRQYLRSRDRRYEQ